MLNSGESFAGYRIVRRLGAGAMGEVYLAQHPRLSRQDAIKVLAVELSADRDFAERFRREADLTASLWHPHIVGVHDRGECAGQLWISMDFVDGTDAAQLLASNPDGLAPAEVADIVEAIAEALDFAHQRGLLHRDVKPANILLSTGGGRRRILLADFGIGRQIAQVNGLTATNMTLGTVSYAAPEQLMGEDIDGRADQYALAAAAYHLLTGGPVFEHSNPAVVISRHLNAEPPAVSTRRADLAALDSVLQRALAKDPGDRFPSCVEFAAQLRATADGSSTHSAAPPADELTASLPNAEVSSSAPTQLAPVPVGAAEAGSGIGSPERPARGSRSRLIGASAVVTVAVAIIALVALWPRGSQSAPSDPAAPAPSSPATAAPATPPRTSVSATVATESPKTQPPAAGPPPARQTPAVVELAVRYGSAFVITESGKTACQIRAGAVGCQVQWTVRTPLKYGAPANGVSISANGDWDWETGDMGNKDFTTLNYGTTYRALGWTVTSTSDGTTFTNNATGHGMHVNVEGVSTF